MTIHRNGVSDGESLGTVDCPRRQKSYGPRFGNIVNDGQRLREQMAIY